MSQPVQVEPRAAASVVLSGPRSLWGLWAAVIGLGLVAKLARGYRPDEVQHLHVAWNISQGLLPYRDFFEHHPPLFHLLLVPLVRWLPQLDLRLAIVSALAELLILLVSLALYGRLLRFSVAPSIARWGVGAWLLLPPYAVKVFELRPDWIALAALLAALVSVARAVAADTARPLGWAMLAGLLTGLGVCLTQKAALIGVGSGVWLLGVSLAAPTDHRQRRVLALLGFGIGGALPLVALGLIFARYDAFGALIEHTLLINLRWVREVPWRQGLQDALAWGFGLLVLGLTQAALIVPRAREHLREATLPSLMVILSGLGLAAYLRSPAPYPQWFLVLVAPWLIYLATVALARYADSPIALRTERWTIAAAALLGALVLSGTIYRLALLLWAGLALLLWWGCRRARTAPQRTRWLFGVQLACPLLYVVVSMALAASFSAAPVQAELDTFVATQAAPDQPILVASWPTVAPFHKHGVYNWLFHHGVLETFAAERARIEDAYITAVASERVRLVLIDPRLVERYVPRFGAYLRQHARRINDLPANPWQLEAYRVGR